MSFKSLIYGFSLWLLVLLMAACERSHPQVEAVLQQADALMEAHPDSAFSLLDSLYYRQPMSSLETARYALLLAKATDKTYQSLIPCDSLLNFALKYYEKPTADRATALLYKGCLEDEVNHDEEAITHLLEARLILQNYPEEVGTRRITLGLLGDLYYQHKHYEDCLPVYQETLELCETDRDKVITYQDISSYYTIKEEKDSAWYYHHKAINQALLAKDSFLIANSYHSLALSFNVFHNADSAYYYAEKALRAVPYNKPRGRYLHTLGLLLIQNNRDGDKAIQILNESITDDTYSNRYGINKLLGQIEEEQKQYEASLAHYRRYINYIDSLYTVERSVDVQQLIYDYDIKLQVKNEQLRSSKERSFIILISSLIILLVLVLATLLYLHKRKQQFKNQLRIKELKSKLTTYQEFINETANALHTEDTGIHKNWEVERYRSKILQLIKDNIDVVEQLKHELYEANDNNAKLLELLKQKEEEGITMREEEELRQCAIALMKTEVMKEITSMAEDLKSEDSLPILSHAKQELLREEVKTIYSAYISRLIKEFPNIKEDYLIYLCLENSGLSIPAIGICFAYTNVNGVYKMRKRVKSHLKS